MTKKNEKREKRKKWKPTLYNRVGTISGQRGEHDDHVPGRLSNSLSNNFRRGN
jgi:hypothetical protein